MAVERRYLQNLKGILYHKDMPLLQFEIKDKQLVSWQDLSGQKMWPAEFKVWGVSYRNFNEFFRRRVVEEHTMFMREWLNALGLEEYDFEKIIKVHSGCNNLDYYWVKMEGAPYQCWDEISKQQWPMDISGLK